MEILGPDHRKSIEQAVITRTKSTSWLALRLCLATFVGLHLLVLSASHLVLLFILVVCAYPVFQFIAIATDKIGVLVTIGLLLSAVSILITVSALITWLLPDSWLMALFSPVERGLALLRSVNPFWPPLVPAFDTREVISAYRDSVAATQAYIVGIGWVLKWITYEYFFASDGLVFFVLFCLQITFLLFILTTAGLFVLAPVAVFVLFSEQLKRRLDATDKGVLPLGALVIAALGETLNMGVSTYKFIWAGG
jgi:hypothetical protein